MSWNYRIIRNENGLHIFDVYYDAAGRPSSTHVQPTYVYGDTVEEMKEQLLLMLEALEQPILEEIEIGNIENTRI